MRAWREKLVVEHITLAKRIALAIRRGLPSSVEFEELFSAALLGLVQAASRYDRKRGPFKPFASSRIRGAIMDYLRDLDNLGRAGRKAQKRGEVLPLSRRIEFHELDQNWLISYDPLPYEETLQKEERRLIELALNRLTPAQRDVIRLIYFDGLTFRATAKLRRCTEGAVSLCHAKALRNLRHSMWEMMKCLSHE